MLTYTFTRREKALLLALALVLVFIVWFVFVYQGTTNQIAEMENQIETTKMQIEVDQGRVAQLNDMRANVEEHKAAGDKPTVMPDYNNVRPLMAELNNIMDGSNSYTLTFDELSLPEEADYVSRGVRIDFNCNSYAEAEGIVESLAKGKFPCRIDSVSISDSSAGRANKATVSASVHVTFFENRTEAAEALVKKSS